MRVPAVRSMSRGVPTACRPQDTERCTPPEDLQIDMEDIETIHMTIGKGGALLHAHLPEDHHVTTITEARRQDEADTEAAAMIMDTEDRRHGADIGAEAIMAEEGMDAEVGGLVLWMI